jgi:glycosyltransferase involved in cell wall biosynthesis
MSLRILHVAPYFVDAWGYGGIPRIVATLTRELGCRGHNVTVCTTDAADALTRVPASRSRASQWSGAEVWVFPNLSNRLAYHAQCFLPRGLNRFLAAHSGDYDVAHLHGCRNLPVSIAARQLQRAGVPYVLAPNGTAPRIERRRLAKWIYDGTIGRNDVSGAAAVIAVSQAECRQLQVLGVPAERIRVVSNPVDLEEHREPPRRGAFRSAHELGDSPLVLFVGKLTPRKRVDVLLEALAMGVGPGVRLAVVGNDMGSLVGLQQEAARLGVSGQVIFTGLLRGAERLEAMADADVLVHPSADEIFGLAPLEALLRGTPVIVADDSGAGEILSSIGGGLVVPLGDPAALAAAIRDVLASPTAWRARAAAAAEQVRQRFGGAVIAEKLDGLYRELARVH